METVQNIINEFISGQHTNKTFESALKRNGAKLNAMQRGKAGIKISLTIEGEKKLIIL
jgi:hypothetical protein